MIKKILWERQNLFLKANTFLAFFLAFLFLSITPDNRAHACGSETKCTIGNRHYLIRMPKGHDGKTKVGAVIFAHGYKGNARAAMKNKSFTNEMDRLGLAFITVKSKGDDWQLPNHPHQYAPEEQTELTYFDDVIEDATKRFPIRSDKLVMTGFSAGGMMTWTLACERSEKFYAFIPLSGTFWAPHPEKCTTPAAHVIHYHGRKDKVVPLKGRKIGPAKQGNIYNVMTMYEHYGEYIGEVTNKTSELACLRKTNPEGKVLELCLHEGGHAFKVAYITRALRKIEILSKINRP